MLEPGQEGFTVTKRSLFKAEFQSSLRLEPIQEVHSINWEIIYLSYTSFVSELLRVTVTIRLNGLTGCPSPDGGIK